MFIEHVHPLLQHRKGQLTVREHGMGLGLEIFFIGLKDVLHVGLGIQIDKRKPSALHLYL